MQDTCQSVWDSLFHSNLTFFLRCFAACFATLLGLALCFLPLTSCDCPLTLFLSSGYAILLLRGWLSFSSVLSVVLVFSTVDSLLLTLWFEAMSIFKKSSVSFWSEKGFFLAPPLVFVETRNWNASCSDNLETKNALGQIRGVGGRVRESKTSQNVCFGLKQLFRLKVTKKSPIQD